MAEVLPQKGDSVVAKRSYPYVNLYQGNRGEVLDAGNFVRVKWLDSRGNERLYSFAKVQFSRYFRIAPAAEAAETPEAQELVAPPEPPAAITGRWKVK